MKPRTVVVIMTIHGCSVPLGILRSRRWAILDEIEGCVVVLAEARLAERPRIDIIEAGPRPSKAKRRKP